MTTNDIWLLKMASKGIKINLSRFIMNKILKVLKEKEKEAQNNRKKTFQSQFAIPYVQPKYEMIPIAVTYNLASITKMEYKDKDNNGIFVKVRGAHDEDNEGKKGEQAQDPATLGQIMDVLGEIQLSIGYLNS